MMHSLSAEKEKQLSPIRLCTFTKQSITGEIVKPQIPGSTPEFL
jgi:hypothetical protein